MPKLSIVTDIPNWVRPFAIHLRRAGWNVSIANLEESIPDGALVFNRISASAGGSKSTLESAKARLQELEKAGLRIINNAECHDIGTSKIAQHQLFEKAGAKTPKTTSVRSGLKIGPTPGFLLKPNVGGYGGEIVAADKGAIASQSLDGLAILQERIISSDNVVHRVELIDGVVLYRALSPISTGDYNYCVANISNPKFVRKCPPDIEKICKNISKLAQLEVGSLEYILDSEDTPWFIDMNPVSTYLEELKEEAFDAVQLYLRKLAETR